MTFTVTYREKTGAKAEVEIEAESRAGCMAECKARGIAPMGIREGRAQATRRQATKGQDTQDRHDAHDRRRAIFLSVLGVLGVLALGTWWWLAGTRDARPYQAKPPAEKPKAVGRPARTLGPREQPPPASTNAPPATFKAKAKPVRTAEVEPPEIRQAKLLEFYHAINPGLVRDHELFTHDSDIMICDVITARPGERLLTIEFDRDFDRKFAESLAEPIPPHGKDTEDDKMVKDAVTKARQMLADRMAAGESPAKILQDARADLNKIADYRDLLESEMRKMADTDDEQTIDAFVAEANKMLDEYGAFHIKMGKRMRAKVRERMEAQGAAPAVPAVE